MDDGADFEEEFFIGFIILSDFVSPHDSDGVTVPDCMSLFTEETLFSIVIVLKSDIAVVDVRFLLGIFPVSFSWEQFDIEYFTESAKILNDFLFAVIIRQLVDVDLVIGEAFLEGDCFACDFELTQAKQFFLVFFVGLGVSIVLVVLSGDDNFAGIKLSLGVLLVECSSNLFSGFKVVDERNFGKEYVNSGHLRFQPNQGLIL